MAWGWRAWRERRAFEDAVRGECAQLRRIAAFGNLSGLSNPDLLALVHRVASARNQLEKLIYAHDDSPGRLILFGAGGILTGTGVVGLAGATLVPILAFVGGVALSVNEIAGLARTHLTLISDQQLLVILVELNALIEGIARARGLI